MKFTLIAPLCLDVLSKCPGFECIEDCGVKYLFDLKQKHLIHSFVQSYSVYHKRLRNRLLKMLEIIEVKVKKIDVFIGSLFKKKK